MDRLTKQLYNDYVHREIVRTYNQKLSKSEMRKILKDCETLARNMTRRSIVLINLLIVAYLGGCATLIIKLA